MRDGWLGFGRRVGSAYRGGSSPSRRRQAAPACVEHLESRDLLALVVGPISPAEGALFQGRVATFASGDVPAVVSTDYHATINWGDGSAVDNATIQFNSAKGNFDVLGVHTYGTAGPYTLTVVLSGSSGSPVTRTGLASVTASTLSVTGQPISAEAGLPFGGVVAVALDSNPSLVPADFTAAINWGDGTNPTAGTIAFRPGGGFSVLGTHTYAQSGSASAHITVTRTATGQFATATAAATVSPPASSLTGSGTTIVVVGGVPFQDAVVATFHSIPPAPASRFVATIDWGDGQTSAGTIVPAAGGNLQVQGAHVYGTAGSFPISVTVVQTSGTSRVPAKITSQAVVQAPAFTGRLDPLSDTGRSDHDGITRLNQLKFSGTARPYSLVQLYSRRPEQLGPVLLGQTAAGGDGSWAVFSGPLLDGRYTITATVTPPDGSPLITAALPPVTIDTVAPQVTLVRYTPAAGTIVVGFRDDRSGMDLATVADRRNYNLVGPAPQRSGSAHPSFVAVAVLPTNPNAALATLRSTLPRNRLRSLQVLAGGIADTAGNPLKGGDFVARLGSGRRARGANP